jgi:sugar lactone lactonase YvrE
VKAPLSDLAFDGDGRLWVRLAVPDGAAQEADVFDPSGRYQGTMRWPKQLRLDIGSFRHGRGLGVTEQVGGGQRVVRLSFRALAKAVERGASGVS